VTVNGRSYAWPTRPTAVVCFDGCDPAYIEAARAAGLVPTIDRMVRTGFHAPALAAMPTFTNPNNVSIVTGVAPADHGVSGNFYLDRETGREVMMVDAAPMRAPTILASFSARGLPVAAVTAKDKLRKALGRGLDLRQGGVAFSAERAGSCTEAENGIGDAVGLVGRGAPSQYSADLSLFVLDAGVEILRTGRAGLLYLSLSDYVQHRHAPGSPEAQAFMAEVDARLGALVGLGAVVGVVADHGMSDMARPDGSPNVVYLGDALDDRFGAGACRVVCPITDPFVRHHGALGGFVRVHLADGAPAGTAAQVARFLAGLPGIALALDRAEACARFDLPADREGDLAVVAAPGVALGARAADHDLSQLAGERLRSHGGLAEQAVPFLLSHPLDRGFAEDLVSRPLRNFDIFHAALNGVRAG
jgi:phosphonoacetate hydrolase